MKIDELIQFLWCCTIVNSLLLLVWVAFIGLTPRWVLATQKKFFDLPDEFFLKTLYVMMGFLKILILVFNVTPLIALYWIRG